MSPDELIIKLESMGMLVSRRTILRYEENKLIPEPKRGSEGRGKGRTTDYPANTPYEFFASWYLIKKHKKDMKSVAEIREVALTNDEEYLREIGLSYEAKESSLFLGVEKWKEYSKYSSVSSTRLIEEYEEQISDWVDKFLETNRELHLAKITIEELKLENNELKDQLKKFKD